MEHLEDPETYVGEYGHVTPGPDDVFNYEFNGIVVGVRNGFLQVQEDAGDSVWEVETSQFSSCPVSGDPGEGSGRATG